MHLLRCKVKKLFAVVSEEEERRERVFDLLTQSASDVIIRMCVAYPQLSMEDVHVILLTRLDLKSRGIADVLGIQVPSLDKRRYRMARKMGYESCADIKRLLKMLCLQCEDSLKS